MPSHALCQLLLLCVVGAGVLRCSQESCPDAPALVGSSPPEGTGTETTEGRDSHDWSLYIAKCSTYQLLLRSLVIDFELDKGKAVPGSLQGANCPIVGKATWWGSAGGLYNQAEPPVCRQQETEASVLQTQGTESCPVRGLGSCTAPASASEGPGRSLDPTGTRTWEAVNDEGVVTTVTGQ